MHLPIESTDQEFEVSASSGVRSRTKKKPSESSSRRTERSNRKKKVRLDDVHFEKIGIASEDDLDLNTDETPFFENELLSFEEFESIDKEERAEENPEQLADEIVLLDRRNKNHRRIDEGAPRLEPRQKVQRRRQIDPTTCERDYTVAEVEFMNALDDYKRSSGRMFPTCSEILEVLLGLGYAKPDLSEEDSEETTVSLELETVPLATTEDDTNPSFRELDTASPVSTGKQILSNAETKPIFIPEEAILPGFASPLGSSDSLANSAFF